MCMMTTADFLAMRVDNYVAVHFFCFYRAPVIDLGGLNRTKPNWLLAA